MSRSAKLKGTSQDVRSWAHKAEDLFLMIREHPTTDPKLKTMIDYFLEHDELPPENN